MRKIALSLGVGMLVATALAAPANAAPMDYQSCWGAASAAFAQTGVMGEHASEQPNPRVGLRNLARDLAEAGVIPDDSMASLGAFVVASLPGIDVGDACQGVDI